MSDLFEKVSDAAASWRPDPARWSMTGHLTHLGMVNEAYVAAVEAAVDAARMTGAPESDGPYAHPWIARRFVRMLEPPPRFRVKTMRSMVPETGVEPADALRRFHELQARLAGTARRARGLDLGRVRFSSPFFRLLRLSLGTGFEVVLAHNRRHVWLIRELMASEGFPG